jgi:hypothetical protein
MAKFFPLLFMATLLIVPPTLSDGEEEAEILKKCQLLFKTRNAIFLRSLKKVLKKAVKNLPQHGKEISTTEDYFGIFHPPAESHSQHASDNVPQSNVGLPTASSAGSFQVRFYKFQKNSINFTSYWFGIWVF